jgi:NAD+ synthase
MDLALWSYNNGVAAEILAAELQLPADTINHVYRDIEVKRKTTRYLHMPAQVFANLEVGK